jgi:hypothetical protein
MPAHHRFLATLLLILPAPAHAAAAELALLPLTVRVYDATGLPEATRTAALAIAGAALGAAQIDTVWRRCDLRRGNSGCDTPPPGGELVIRIVGARIPPPGTRGLVLGDALLERPSGEGRLATIYSDRVERLAHAASVDAARLLGYAIAHELGHLLLATSEHSRQGLMRAVWSNERVRRAIEDDWRFTDREIAAIRGRRMAVPVPHSGRND